MTTAAAAPPLPPGAGLYRRPQPHPGLSLVAETTAGSADEPLRSALRRWLQAAE